MTISTVTNPAEKQYQLNADKFFDASAFSTWTWTAFTLSNSACNAKISYKIVWDRTEDSSFLGTWNGAYNVRTITLTKKTAVNLLGYHYGTITAYGEDGIAITTKTAKATLFVINSSCIKTALSVTKPADITLWYTLAGTAMSQNFNLWTDS